MVFLTVLLPALLEVTLKVALILPVFDGRTLTLTVRVAPALIEPPEALDLMPRPETVSLTPVACALPVFLIFAL